jgi:hypothetical protein
MSDAPGGTDTAGESPDVEPTGETDEATVAECVAFASVDPVCDVLLSSVRSHE